jgi:hypothetical protein
MPAGAEILGKGESMERFIHPFIHSCSSPSPPPSTTINPLGLIAFENLTKNAGRRGGRFGLGCTQSPGGKCCVRIASE